MKNYDIRIALFIIVCGIMSNGKIDGAEEYRVPRLLSDEELLKAAENLPEVYDPSHVCIQLLDEALCLFSGQRKAYEAGNNLNTTAPQVLAQIGGNAMYGARCLINHLIKQRRQDKEFYDKTINDKKDFIAKLQTNEKRNEEKIKDMGVQIEQKEALLRRADIGVKALQEENYRQKIVFFSFASLFLGYLLCKIIPV